MRGGRPTTGSKNSDEQGSEPASAPALPRLLELGSWLALLLAFSPLIAQLLLAIVRLSQHRHALVGWVLLALALRHARTGRIEPRLNGLTLVGLGGALEVIGIASGSWSLARLGWPLAACGIALRFGRPPPSVALLTVWTLPFPAALLPLLRPFSIHPYLAELSVHLLTPLGAPLSAVGRAVHTPDAMLDVTSRTGWILAYVLAGLGWYSVARGGGSARRALSRATLWAACAIPLQAFSVLVAVTLLWLVGPQPARDWLDPGSWLLVAAIGLALVERRQRARAS